MNIIRYAKSWVAPICALAFLASPVWAQEFTFKLHHLLPPKAPAQTKMLEPWVKQVEKNAG
ncbi:MAG: C4-dicarboxylate ABC transporter substrate-binding protein, partial [Gammaproteobacteria bacterium]